MRFRRMTTRRWMLMVAIAAMATGYARLFRRSARYQTTAGLMRERADAWRDEAKLARARASELLWRDETPAENVERGAQDEARGFRMAAYYDRLNLKYRRASRYPWLVIETDPPEPK